MSERLTQIPIPITKHRKRRSMGLPKLTPELWYHRLGTTYVVAQIMFHLNQTGVIAWLADKGASSSGDLSKALNLNLGKLETLLNYVASVDEVIALDEDGKYFFTEFGREVIKRYSRVENEFKLYNFHEVRVGAYGNVWDSIGQLLTGEKVYGKDIKRRGEFAETGVYAQALKFRDPLLKGLQRFKPKTVIEFGANTGLTEQVATSYQADLFCLDRSPESLTQAEQRFCEKTAGQAKANWLQTDIFDSRSWAQKITNKDSVSIFSIHFHELISKGPQVMIPLFKELRAAGVNGEVLMLEQPRLKPVERESISESLWLYSQSNILIHHFIGNGQILSSEDWRLAFKSCGCEFISQEPTGYLGYDLFCFKI